MTISSETRKAGPFTGNGVTTVFPFEFKVFTTGDVYVVQTTDAGIESELTMGSDYTVTLNGDQDNDPGGSITTTSALATGYKLTITSSVANKQETDITNQGGFYPQVVEDALDRATIQIQQIAERQSRSLTVPLSTASDVDTALPPPESDKLIGWNSDATALQNIDGQTLATIVAYGTAEADVFTGDGTTTVFTLSSNPARLQNISVSVGGVAQLPTTDYTWTSGTTLTFTSAPPDGVKILVRYMQALAQAGAPTFEMLASDDGSSLSGFGQAGDGAVARTVQDKLRDVVSIKDFGAAGDNSADDTAEIQAAVDAVIAAGGGALLFPRGIYKISSAITITAPVTLCGEGASESVIRQSGSTANGIVFDFSSLVQGGGIEDITVEAGSGWVSAGNQGSGSAGIGVVLRNSNGKFYVKNLGVHNFDTSVRLRGCFYTVWSNFELLYATTGGVLIDTSDGTSGGTIGAGNWFSNGKVSNYGFSGTNTGSTGVKLLASGGDFFSSVDVTTFNKGWQSAPTAGKQVLYTSYENCLGDTSLSHNWEFDGTSGGVWSIGLNSCWGAYSTGGYGLRVLGSSVDSIRWTGGRIRENGRHGVSLEGGVNVNIVAAEIASNGKSSAGTYHGVDVAANVSQWSVSNSRIGNFASGFDTQQNGINIASGTSQNFTISCNDIRGNLNQAVSLGTSSSIYYIAGNLPFQTFGMNASAAVSYSSSTPSTVAAASTVYLGPNGLGNAAATDCTWVSNKTGVVREFYAAVNSAPGGTQTFTYTVYKNGIATSMTGTITGSSFSVSTTGNPVAISPGDYLSIQLVTSGTATAAKHRYYLSVE